MIEATNYAKQHGTFKKDAGGGLHYFPISWLGPGYAVSVEQKVAIQKKAHGDFWLFMFIYFAMNLIIGIAMDSNRYKSLYQLAAGLLVAIAYFAYNWISAARTLPRSSERLNLREAFVNRAMITDSRQQIIGLTVLGLITLVAGGFFLTSTEPMDFPRILSIGLLLALCALLTAMYVVKVRGSSETEILPLGE